MIINLISTWQVHIFVKGKVKGKGKQFFVKGKGKVVSPHVQNHVDFQNTWQVYLLLKCMVCLKHMGCVSFQFHDTWQVFI